MCSPLTEQVRVRPRPERRRPVTSSAGTATPRQQSLAVAAIVTDPGSAGERDEDLLQAAQVGDSPMIIATILAAVDLVAEVMPR